MGLRILLVNTGYLPVPPNSSGPLAGGSIELHTYYLANELARLGNEVHYVTNITENASFAKGIVLHKIPFLSLDSKGNYPETAMGFALGGFLAFSKALKAINTHNFDVVHGHGNISSALLLSIKKKSKYVFTVHNRTPWMLTSASLKQAFRKTVFTTLDLRIINKVDRIITVSKNLKKELVSRFGTNSAKVEVIANGVDLEFFRPSIPNSANVRSKYGINHDFALFVGRLVEEKGVDSIIRAVAGTELDAVIVGNGPLLPHLKNMSVRLGVHQKVHFIGSIPRSELPTFYAQAAFLVLPSIAEGGSPLVGLEAMASGLPIIASHASGMEDIIEHGYNGFLFNARNIEELRCRLTQLHDDRSLINTMSKRSREIAEDKFSWAHVAEKTSLLYEKLVDNS